MSTVKRLALSIVQFLAEQKQYGNMSPDAQVSSVHHAITMPLLIFLDFSIGKLGGGCAMSWNSIWIVSWRCWYSKCLQIFTGHFSRMCYCWYTWSQWRGQVPSREIEKWWQQSNEVWTVFWSSAVLHQVFISPSSDNFFLEQKVNITI